MKTKMKIQTKKVDQRALTNQWLNWSVKMIQRDISTSLQWELSPTWLQNCSYPVTHKSNKVCLSTFGPQESHSTSYLLDGCLSKLLAVLFCQQLSETSRKNISFYFVYKSYLNIYILNYASVVFPAEHICPPEQIDFISRCLEKDPSMRLTASEMLVHPWLTEHGKVKLKNPPC